MTHPILHYAAPSHDPRLPAICARLMGLMGGGLVLMGFGISILLLYCLIFLDASFWSPYSVLTVCFFMMGCVGLSTVLQAYRIKRGQLEGIASAVRNVHGLVLLATVMTALLFACSNSRSDLASFMFFTMLAFGGLVLFPAIVTAFLLARLSRTVHAAQPPCDQPPTPPV